MGSTISIYVDDRHVDYGQANLIPGEGDEDARARLVEDGEQMLAHAGAVPPDGLPSMAFVDGVRRAEAFLSMRDPDAGVEARGLAGSFACGCVVADKGQRPRFGPHRVERLAIWGSSRKDALPALDGGWRWEIHTVADDELSRPLRELEQCMRRAEGKIADELPDTYITVVDGPLDCVARRHREVIGYIKTHHVQLLPGEHHARVPDLEVGQRTSLFAIRDELYSAYVRVGAPSAVGSPWTGIARIELPQGLGLPRARDLADRVTGALPSFAGVAHRDPRAPLNLQPVGALESYLRRLLGSQALARRAPRDALFRTRKGETP